MAEKRDYYEILDVSVEVDDGELKKKYRKLAMRYHPDRNPGDKAAEDKFKEAAEAYEVLKDPKKRQIYNQYGHKGLEGAGFSGTGGFDDIFSNFGDIFEDFFGFGGGRKRSQNMAQKGADLRYDLTIDFMDAAFGIDKRIEIEKAESCDECGGNGCKSGTKPEVCSKCHGTGQFSQSQGFFTVKTVCPYCNGQGRRIGSPCNKCRGQGKVNVRRTMSVKIPAGVDTGSRIRLTGEGGDGVRNGPKGDLYVFISVKKHKFFQRNNTDIVCIVEISFVQAILGDVISIPTLKGEKDLKIPSGTQYGDTLRLRGEGVPSLRSKYPGDQIIQIDIKIPKKVSKKQEKLLKDYKKADSEKLSNKLKNLFNM